MAININTAYFKKEYGEDGLTSMHENQIKKWCFDTSEPFLFIYHGKYQDACKAAIQHFKVQKQASFGSITLDGMK